MGRDFLLRSRHNTRYYFRRKVPADLQARLGATQIYRTLHTTDRREAVVSARAMAVRTDLLFSMAREMPPEDPKLRELLQLIHHRAELYELREEIWDLRDKLTDAHVEKNKLIRELERKHSDQIKEIVAAAAAGTAAAHPVAPARFTTMTVREAMEQMFKAKGLKPRSQKRYRSIYEDFAAFVGWSAQLHEITPVQFANYADLVNSDPKRAVATKTNYIIIAARLFNWANTRDKRIPAMTTKGLKPKRTRPAYKDRPAHTLGELGHIFEHVAQSRLTHPHWFWATVATAFLGCRIEELAQADLDKDLKQDPASGVWYLDVQEDEELSAHEGGKSVKKLGSWRQVPIHSALIRHGFLSYLNGERSAGAKTPFERRWKPSRDKETGAVTRAHSISKWGSRQMPRLRSSGLITTKRSSFFHSMRHTLSTELALRGVSPEWRAALCGQETTGGGVNEEIYTKLKTNPAALYEMVEKHMGEYVRLLDAAVTGAATEK